MKAKSIWTALLALGASAIALCLLLAATSSAVLGADDDDASVDDTAPTPWVLQALPGVGDQGGCSSGSIAANRLALHGDVATRDNCLDATVCSWFEGTPTGTIILGADPASPDPADWEGGSATWILSSGVPVTWRIELLVNWPNGAAKGIHSPDPGVSATIEVDGSPLWAKRALYRGAYGHYYAAKSPPVATTFVITGQSAHTVTLTVPPHTVWDVSELHVTNCSRHASLKGYSYRSAQSRSGLGADPMLTVGQIEADLALLYHNANAIRTYGSCGVQGRIPELAQKYDLGVAAGIWLDGDQANNAREIACAIAAAGQYSSVHSIVVGSEVLQRGDLSEGALLDAIRQVKAGVDVPVTTADTWDILKAHPQVVQEVDYVLVHIHPWWDAWSGATITDPVQYVLDTYYDVVQQARKPVTIGETGWPSDGEPRGLARPGLREQCLFYTGFLRAADEALIPFYYATIFDEPGRTEPGGVGGHWGLHYTDGSAKHQIQGILWRADSKGLENPVCTPPYRTIYVPLVRNAQGLTSR